MRVIAGRQWLCLYSVYAVRCRTDFRRAFDEYAAAAPMFFVFLRRFVELIPDPAEHATAGPPAVEFGGLRDRPAIPFSSGFPERPRRGGVWQLGSRQRRSGKDQPAT
jgi:hypothetical protein